MAIQAFLRSTRGAGAVDRPRTTHRQDLVTVLLATWLIAGIGLDGWAHSNLERQTESFFTPWHGVFYSGFAATALWVLWLVQTRRAEHPTWTQAVPQGYSLGVVGVAVFAVGGVGDLLWHQVFGIETGIAALLSPTHLLLFSGVALILLAPFRAAWSSLEPPSAGLLGLLPAFLSITLLTALVAFFSSTARCSPSISPSARRSPSGSRKASRPSWPASSKPGPRTSRKLGSWPRCSRACSWWPRCCSCCVAGACPWARPRSCSWWWPRSSSLWTISGLEESRRRRGRRRGRRCGDRPAAACS